MNGAKMKKKNLFREMMGFLSNGSSRPTGRFSLLRADDAVLRRITESTSVFRRNSFGATQRKPNRNTMA